MNKIQGVVINKIQGFYYVEIENQVLECKLRGVLKKKNNKYKIGIVNLFGQEKIIYESEKMGVDGDEIEVCKFTGKELGKELWGTICSDKQLKLFVNEKSYEELKRNGKDLMREGCDRKVWEERMRLWGLLME